MLALAGPALAKDGYARVGGATFRSVLPDAPGSTTATVAPFQLQRRPVTHAEFLAFVREHPQWRRGTAPPLFVDASYLARWAGPEDLGTADPQQPVTQVSWFAAVAYCEAQGARLPRWHEWEWSAAADERRADARTDPEWRQRILGWYSRPGGAPLPRVGLQSPNHWGVQDLHGLVWEWTGDFGAMLVSGDNREQGADPDLAKFCGTGGLTMEDKENYAVLMRIAMLSSLEARYTAGELGFRCARDAAP